MPYVIMRNEKSKFPFLGFSDTGRHEWKSDRLDAIRYGTAEDAQEVISEHIREYAMLRVVDARDGHYETYLDYEIQVYFDHKHRVWRYRIGPLMPGRATEYSPKSLGFTDCQSALNSAKRAVEKRPRVESLKK